MSVSIVPFEKMHGAGNDFVIIHRKHLPENIAEPKLAKKLAQRNFSIGADGLIIVEPPQEEGDFAWTYLNSDGSYAQMCGNGMRCFAKYVFERGLIRKKNFSVETLAGLIKPEILENGLIRIEMGEPIFAPEKIPLDLELSKNFVREISFFEEFCLSVKKNFPEGKILEEKAICSALPMQISAGTFKFTTVSMGNPHCVIFVDSEKELETLNLKKVGSEIERSSLFPENINVEFVYQEKKTQLLKIRVWERGSGETLACGTGACACAVVATLESKVKPGEEIRTILPGGELLVNWDLTKNKIYLSGEAESVFIGQIELEI